MTMESKMIYVVAILVVAVCVNCQQKPKEPPKITKSFLSEYYVTEANSEPRSFYCHATGYPDPTYEWRKDGVKITSTQRIKVNETSGTLSIVASVYPSDFGNYQCFAINELGTAMAGAFDVKRGYITQFSDKNQRIISSQEYSSVKIDCVGKANCQPKQDCKIEWKRGEGTSESITESDRIAVSSEGTLFFLYVESADQSTQNDPIACGVNHEPAKAFFKGGPVILNVVSVAQPIQHPPVAVFNNDVKGILGSQITLQCIFSGYPIPVITWHTPDNTEIHANEKYRFEFENNKRNLIIRNLLESDEGSYLCRAESYAGRGEAQVFLNVTSKPIFPREGPRLESAVVPRGENAKFICKMKSLKGEQPPSAPMWFRNGMELPASEVGPGKKYILTEDSTVLTVAKVQKPGDTCSFMCMTGNVIIDDMGNDKYVTSYADASLRVIDPIVVTVLTDRMLELDSPLPFSMSVSVTADPTIRQLSYNWSLMRPDNKTVITDTELSKQTWVKFTNDKNNLTIFPQLSEAGSDDDKVRDVVGVYTLNVSHTYDEVVTKFEITTNLEQATKAPIVQSAGFDLWIIGLILGIIVLLIVVMFIICTLYRNRGGEYPVDKKEVAAGHDPEKELKDSGFHDLSRADGEKVPFDRVSLSDDVKPLESDEDSMMGDYDDDADMTKFNEDGSFIGVYMDKKGLLHG